LLRVAIDANCLAWGWGGIPKYVDRISRELANLDGVDVTLLANSDRPFADIPGVRQEFSRLKGGVLWRNVHVTRWLRRNRPDVFWAPEGLTPLRVPVPFVLTVHDVATALIPRTKPARVRLAYRYSIPRAARAAQRVLCVSHTTAHEVRRLWRVPERAIRVVPVGIDDQFTPGDRSASQDAIRDRFGIEPPFVLAVGDLEPRKGLEVLVDAAAAARSRGLTLQFVLAGAPGFRSRELIERAKATGCFSVLGYVTDDDLVHLYRAAEALATPSLYEGFGLTPLEAMACGTPAVVAGGAGALEEVSGEAAIIVRERRPEAWLSALADAVRRRSELAERGLRAASKFRWPHIARQVEEALAEAAGRR
jgi:glycosyltransferase involved in cell wall biosynthesis